jgi:pimeloyl-ACP methyl ester carboxylesterase
MLTVFIGITSASDKDFHYRESVVDSIYQQIRQEGVLYEWEKEIVNFENEGMNLVATLVIPKMTEKPPIAITLNGFGEDRHYVEIPETGGEHFYERVSRLLAEQGIATLRIDYRGSGDSDGSYEMTTFSSQVSDTIAAINYVQLRLKNKVDWKNLGLVGFSQGGLVASIVAAQDKRVDSLALWSAVASPPITYEYLLKRDGIQQGLDLPDGGIITIPVYIGDLFYGDITLGKEFFIEMVSTNPLASIKEYEGPMLYVAGAQDKIVWPQPQMADMFIKYHEGFEKLVVLDTDHEFKTYLNAEEFDKTIHWTAAWFRYTLQ